METTAEPIPIETDLSIYSPRGSTDLAGFDWEIDRFDRPFTGDFGNDFLNWDL